jgi:type I restriction enzyme, S subunit
VRVAEEQAGWQTCRLSDVAEIVRGITFPTDAKQHEPTDGHVACLRTANVQAEVEWDDLWYVPRQYVRGVEQYVREDDVLISTANSYELVGKVARVTSLTREASLGAFISLLRAEAGMDPGYFYYLLSSENIQRSIRDMASTTTNLSNVSGAKLQELRLPIAPPSEQARIVDKLEELLSDLDAGVAELKAAQKKLAQYRQSLLKAAVEGRLTEAWRAQHGEPEESGAQLLARILRERRVRWEARQFARFKALGKPPPKGWQDKYPEPAVLPTTGLPELPQSWTWASFDQVVYDLRSGSAETSGRQPTEFPVLKSSAVRQGRIDFQALNYLEPAQSDRTENFLELGDLLITRLSGSVEYVGCCAQVKDIPVPRVQFPDRIFRAKVPLFSESFGSFLVCCFRSGYVRALLEAAAKSTAGHKRISLSDLHLLPIPVPPALEIGEIVEQLQEMLERADRGDQAVEAATRQSAAQRKNILQAAFAGQLVPQDPNDEPASVLLARIRAERAAREAAPSEGTRAARRRKEMT